jgi:hypothetical protein
MSDAGLMPQPPADQETIQPTVPETPAPPEKPTEQPAPESPKPADEQPKPDAAKAAKRPYQQRIDQLTAKITAAERKALEAEQRAALFEEMAKKGQEPVTAPDGRQLTVAELERLADERAAIKVAQQTLKDKTDQWLGNGNKEFGATEFADKCNEVARLGAGDNPEFMQLMADLPDAHKVIAKMADMPDETARILALPPRQMTIEITRLALEKTATAQVSNAPKPITPIDGTARANTDPSDDDTTEAWMAKRRKQVAEREKRGTYSRF